MGRRGAAALPLGRGGLGAPPADWERASESCSVDICDDDAESLRAPISGKEEGGMEEVGRSDAASQP